MDPEPETNEPPAGRTGAEKTLHGVTNVRIKIRMVIGRRGFTRLRKTVGISGNLNLRLPKIIITPLAYRAEVRAELNYIRLFLLLLLFLLKHVFLYQI